MSGSYGYYTGIIFRAYTYGTGDAVVRGGRYDHLLEKFGKNTPSIGFAIILDELMNALNRQNIQVETGSRNLLVYTQDTEKWAISLARTFRNKGKNIEMLKRNTDEDRQVYEEYGKRSSVMTMLYLRDDLKIEMINFRTGEKKIMDTKSRSKGAEPMRYLTFALTKGRLASKTLDMLEKLGITCDEMKDKNSRKLIFTNEELGLRFFLAKVRMYRPM